MSLSCNVVSSSPFPSFVFFIPVVVNSQPNHEARSQQRASPGIRGNDRHSTVDRVTPPYNRKSSAQELGFNPNSSGPISPQVKHPGARVQPRLVGPNITSYQALRNSGSTQTRRPRHHLANHRRARSPSVLEASGKLLNGVILRTTRLDLNYVNRTDLTSS